jgi:hypothetical protein
MTSITDLRETNHETVRYDTVPLTTDSAVIGG